MKEQWQNMENAPKDGTYILVADDNGVVQASWQEEGWYELNNEPDDNWGGPIYPTKWMPMPTPPLPAPT